VRLLKRASNDSVGRRQYAAVRENMRGEEGGKVFRFGVVDLCGRKTVSMRFRVSNDGDLCADGLFLARNDAASSRTLLLLYRTIGRLRTDHFDTMHSS
jgi:hypothetical protein